MIRAVIFDCFGVLYLDASRHFYEHHIANYAELQPQLAALNRAYDSGMMSREELHREVATLAGLPLAFVQTHISGVHKRNHALLEYAQLLRTQYKVGMLSNIGIGGMETYFDVHDRHQLFDAVVLSGEVGMVKPQPEIYQLMAERLDVEPEECVMIDDIADNIAGAHAAGMSGIVYHTNQQTIHDVTKII